MSVNTELKCQLSELNKLQILKLIYLKNIYKNTWERLGRL